MAAACLGAGESRPLGSCVPRDAMAVYFGRPSPEMMATQPAGAITQLSGWIITLKAMGVIPAQGRVLADLVGTLPLLSRRPHAFMLLDVTSRPVAENVYRLNTMQSALVLDDQEVGLDIERRMRDLIATYTDAANATIKPLKAGNLTYQRLYDARLPEWAVLEWGTHGHQFVLGFGEGAFMRVLDTLQGRTPSLADDPWYAMAHEKCHGATSGIEMYVDIVRIRKRVGEVAKGRPEEVLRSLGLERAERMVWTVGFEGPALHSEALGHTQGGRDEYVMLTGPAVNAPEVTAAIPPDATRYAAFRFPLAPAVRSAKEAYLSSQSPSKRQNLHELWARLEREFGFNLEEDLVARLGQDLVFHNWPPHPLGVPLLCTVWIGYTGDRASMTAKLDRILQAGQELMTHPLVQSQPSRGLVPRLMRGEDGIWYFQLGLIGPAVAVADRWLVLGYSREAVRQNLAYLEQRAATQPATQE